MTILKYIGDGVTAQELTKRIEGRMTELEVSAQLGNAINRGLIRKEEEAGVTWYRRAFRAMDEYDRIQEAKLFLVGEKPRVVKIASKSKQRAEQALSNKYKNLIRVEWL